MVRAWSLLTNSAKNKVISDSGTSKAPRISTANDTEVSSKYSDHITVIIGDAIPMSIPASESPVTTWRVPVCGTTYFITANYITASIPLLD